MCAASAFDSALASFAQQRAKEERNARLNPDCYSILLEHREPTPRAVVLMHGITSSPPQFAALAVQLHARGDNVLVPRLPYHGYQDRLNTDQARLTADDLKRYANAAIAIAANLGEQLIVVGLSVDGVVAGWCAQFKHEVDRAVMLAPSFAPFGVPMQLVKPLAKLALRLPNAFIWWDPRVKDKLEPPTSYPRFSSHAMAHAFLLGSAVYQAARQTPPQARRIVSVTSRRDMAVNNNATAAVLRRWRTHHSVELKVHEFRDLGRLHDFIGPYQPGARVDLVYPILLDLIDARA